MDKNSILDDIFNNDPFDILNVKPKSSGAKTTDERLLNSFQEINDFVEKNKREPQPNISNVSEYQLYTRLKGIRENPEKKEQLKDIDTNNLLDFEIKEINSIDDIFNDDAFDLFDDDTDLFDFKHTPKPDERVSTDFVARRKPMKDFDNYEHLFKDIQKDLANGKRKLVDFKMGNLREGAYYVHNGVLFLLEEIQITKKEHYREDGTRVREDGRTRCIFENGTVSNMLKRSVEKILYANGQVVSENIDKVNESFVEKFSNITDEDEEAGFIYVLSSKSKDEKVASIENLFKIGYSKVDVLERIKNAEKEPTYLMAKVKIESAWKCYNMNPQKLEQLITAVKQTRNENLALRQDNYTLHSQNQELLERINQAQERLDLLLHSLEQRVDAPPSEGNN